MKVTPHPEEKMIRFDFRNPKSKRGKYVSGKSGPIKCDKGFKVRFDLRKHERPMNKAKPNWIHTRIMLTKYKTPWGMMQRSLASL